MVLEENEEMENLRGDFKHDSSIITHSLISEEHSRWRLYVGKIFYIRYDRTVSLILF